MGFQDRRLRRVSRRILDTLLPAVCPGCGEEIEGSRWVCGPCRRAFRPAPRAWLCLACRMAGRVGGDREAGFRCHEGGHAPLWGRAGFWMEPPLDAFIHALKFGARPDLARPLGRLLARTVDVPRETLVTAVPLHRTRRRERGYDQAELLARAAAGGWGTLVLPGLLTRPQATRAQARLQNRERPANVAGAFAGVPEAGVARAWVLVDDVVTTGATLLSAAEVLRRHGSLRILPVALAVA